MSDTLKSEEFRETRQQLEGWPIRITSYRVGGVFHCTIDNVDPGARFARADGATRDEAESKAIEKAGRYLRQTIRRPAASRT